jgi:hypothetical protein
MYDVALSFRAHDLGLAEQLRDRLSPLNCFVYSRNQDVVAATDGLETFRNVFRNEARLNVILFRSGWGNTPWTGVEEIAIRDACLQTKYANLVFVRLDSSVTPSWLPDTHQLFDLTLYPIDQLVGVIKSRAQALGSVVRAESAVEKAQRIAHAEQLERETRQYLHSEAAVMAARESFTEIKAALAEQTELVAKTHPGWAARFGSGSPSHFEVHFAGLRLYVTFEHFSNSVRDCCAKAEFMKQRDYKSERVGSDVLEVAHTPAMGICWKPVNGTPLAPGAVADRWLNRMLELRRSTS